MLKDEKIYLKTLPGLFSISLQLDAEVLGDQNDQHLCLNLYLMCFSW